MLTLAIRCESQMIGAADKPNSRSCCRAVKIKRTVTSQILLQQLSHGRYVNKIISVGMTQHVIANLLLNTDVGLCNVACCINAYDIQFVANHSDRC